MTGNNVTLMKTLKTINDVIGDQSFTNNQNNSIKKSKKYIQKTESYYHENNKPQKISKSHKNLERKANSFRLFQKNVLFRKWLYRLSLKLNKLKKNQNGKKTMKGIQKQLYDYQFIRYSDNFRIPPKHYVDRMRRILPNFEFNHIEQARRDKYDIKLLWPVNNILFPPKEKETRIHKIPVPGRNDYLEQAESVNRLSEPKTDYSNVNNIQNNYYRHKKISQKEALELCQRLNFKPSQKNNYDYIKDCYNLYDYEIEQKRKRNSKKQKNSSFSHSNYYVDIEKDQNLSNLAAELGQKSSSQHSSSNEKIEINNNNSNNITTNSSNKKVITSNSSHNSIKINQSIQEKIEKVNSTQNIKNASNNSINKNNNHSYGSNTEENTEIVSDSYLLDTSANQIKRNNGSSLIATGNEEEEANTAELINIKSDSTNNSYHNNKTELSEEEVYNTKLTNNSYNNSYQTKSSSYQNIQHISSVKEEEEMNNSSITNSSQIKNSLHQNIHNILNEEEEEIFNQSKSAQAISNSYNDIGIEEEEEISDESPNNSGNKEITNNYHNNFHTEINEEEDISISSTNHIIRKTSSKVIHTTISSNHESPTITHVVKQFSHSTSKKYDNADDELFSDTSVDNGILIGSTSSGIGPNLQNSIETNHNLQFSNDSDS